MDEHRVHFQQIGNIARMLSARAAKAHKRIFADVISALHRYFFYGLRHILIGNAQKTLGQFFGALVVSGISCNLIGQFFKFRARGVCVKSLIGIGPEKGGEMVGRDTAGHNIGICHA